MFPEENIHFDSFSCFVALSENICCSAAILFFSIIGMLISFSMQNQHPVFAGCNIVPLM